MTTETRILHVDDGARESLCGLTMAGAQGEWFGNVRWHKPTCPACIAIVVLRQQYGPVPWWNAVRRLQLRAEALRVRRESRAARTAIAARSRPPDGGADNQSMDSPHA